MSKYCPIVDSKVTYQFCEDCDDRLCVRVKENPRTIDEPHILAKEQYQVLEKKEGT